MINFFKNIFKVILYRPLFNALILLYQYLPGHDFGIAVITLTVITRILLYPLMAVSIKSQKAMAGIQPKVQEIQQKFKNDKEKQTKELLELYQREKINPFSGILPLLIQFPLLICLYRVFLKGFEPGMMVYLYSFVPRPEAINPLFLGIINLSSSGTEINLALGVLAGVLSYFQAKMLSGNLPEKKQGEKSSFASIIQKQSLYFFPVLIIFLLWGMPAAVSLYWITTSLLSILQQYFLLKPKVKPVNVEIK